MNKTSNDKEQILKPLTPEQVSNDLIEWIEEERKGIQLGLLTRFPKLNIAFRKYFRFNQVNLFAGLSGHGKSFLINLLSEDFLDYRKGGINSNINFVPIILHFCFEMSAINELLRSISSDMGLSFNYLLSSERITKEDGTKAYNNITDEELDIIKKVLIRHKSKSILFFENASTVEIVERTIYSYYKHYTKLSEKNGIKYKFIINFDHTLLFEKGDENTITETIRSIGKMAIRIRKTIKAMVNLIGQLNNAIEDTKRLTNPILHYPQKSDIYAQGELFNACDNVTIFHRPELLKIEHYGKFKYPTKGLIHLLIIKARFGDVGSIWFKEDFKHGRILELEDHTKTNNPEDESILNFDEQQQELE